MLALAGGGAFVSAPAPGALELRRRLDAGLAALGVDGAPAGEDRRQMAVG